MRNKLLNWIARSVVKYPLAIVITAIVLAGVGAYLGAVQLQMNTNQDDLVSEKLDYHKRYMDYIKKFGDLEYIYIVAEVDSNLDDAKAFVKTVSERLAKLPDIKEVTYQLSNPALEKSFLLYLSKDELKQLTSFLSKGPTSLENISRWSSLNQILATMNRMMASPEVQKQEGELRSSFEFFRQLVDGMSGTLESGNVVKPNLASAFLGGSRVIDEDGYLISSNGKLLFSLIMPEKSYATLSVIEKPLQEIRKVLDETRKEFPNVKAGLTGRPILQADEMRITNRDMTVATILAIIATTLLFILYFRRLTRPLLAITALIFAIAWTFGLATITIGYLNLLSTVFAVILVGAGIEFGLQIISRYREDLHFHKDPKHAVHEAITQTGMGNLTSALTTTAAFYVAIFTDFKALQELGFIAGTGILLCLVSLVVVLPAMMYLADKDKPKTKYKTELLIDLKGIGHLYNRPKLIIIILAVITVIGIPGILKLNFDHNLLNLQAKGLESVEYEKMIIDRSDESTWYAVSLTKTLDESERVRDEMSKKMSVGKVESLADIVPADQEGKRKLVSELKNVFNVGNPVAIDGKIDISGLKKNLSEMSASLTRLTEMAFSSGHIEAVDELEGINKKIIYILGKLPALSDAQLKNLDEFQKIFITKFRGGLDMLKSGLDPATITLNDIPESIRKKFMSTDEYATYVYPKSDIWDPEKMNEFIADIRSVDPQVLGTPVEVYESSRLMQKSFQRAALYAFLVITILVLIDFKRPKYAFLAMAPLVMGIVWLLELMGWLGIQFNLANFFAIPVLLGVGVDNGVQIIHRFIQEKSITKAMSKSTGAAILLTSLTTGVSFGTLIISAHRGIMSLGIIMTLGAITCMIGSMLLLPVMLKLVEKR